MKVFNVRCVTQYVQIQNMLRITFGIHNSSPNLCYNNTDVKLKKQVRNIKQNAWQK